MSVRGFGFFELALEVLFHPQRVEPMGINLGSVCRFSSPSVPNFRSLLPPRMHR